MPSDRSREIVQEMLGTTCLTTEKFERACEILDLAINAPSIKYIQTVERVEDMSPDGRLKLFREDDGDIIVSIIPPSKKLSKESMWLEDMQVQFCSLAGGGGRSRHTREALFTLMEAIEKDNAENPIQ